MDLKTEGQLRQEIEEAWKLIDQYKRAAYVRATERDHARAHYERTVKILTGIHALLYPPRVTRDDGVSFEFHSPHVHEQMQALSDRIRAIPDEIEASEQPAPEKPNV